jgi:hypothetical protein
MHAMAMSPLKTFAAVILLAVTAIGGSAAAHDSERRSMMNGWDDSDSGQWMMGPSGMMGNGPAGPWMMRWRNGGAGMCTAMAGHIDGRLAYVKAELKITAAQDALWNAYADAARDNANTMIARCTTMWGQAEKSELSLPDRLDLHEQFMADQLDHIRAVDKALKPLYAAFSDDQKHTADQLFWTPMGMM